MPDSTDLLQFARKLEDRASASDALGVNSVPVKRELLNEVAGALRAAYTAIEERIPPDEVAANEITALQEICAWLYLFAKDEVDVPSAMPEHLLMTARFLWQEEAPA